MAQLTLNGIVYDILRDEAHADIETTRPDTAQVMHQVGAQRLLVLKRPCGKNAYLAYDFGAHPYKERYRILG